MYSLTLEDADEKSFCALLQCQQGRCLPFKVGIAVVADLADNALERKFRDKEVDAFLVAPDVAQCHSCFKLAR
jgi:hypothetical protein